MTGVFTEPLAAAFEIAEQVHVKPSDKVLVLGDGKLGLLIALVLHHCGVDVVVSGRHEEKLAIAARQMVRTRRAEELRESRAFEIVIEATGSPKGLESALEQVVPRGTIVLKSTVADPGEVNLSRAVVDEVTLVGSRCGPFAPAVAALASGRLHVQPLVSAVYPFDDALSAFEKAGQKGTLKSSSISAQIDEVPSATCSFLLPGILLALISCAPMKDQGRIQAGVPDSPRALSARTFPAGRAQASENGLQDLIQNPALSHGLWGISVRSLPPAKRSFT